MNTKAITAFAVFIMMFAGFGFLFAGADAAEISNTDGGVAVTIVVVSDDEIAGIEDIYADTSIVVAVTLDEALDAEEIPSFVASYVDETRMIVTAPLEDIGDILAALGVEAEDIAADDAYEYTITYEFDNLSVYTEKKFAAAVDTAVAKYLKDNELFTQADVDEAVADAVAGLFTQEQVDEAVAAATGELFTQEQVDAIVAIAVIDAAAEGGDAAVEAFLENFLTAEELVAIEKDVAIALINDPELDVEEYSLALIKSTIVGKAVTDAVAKATDGLYTKEQLDKAVADAVAAVEPAEPVVKENQTYLYMFIVALAVAIVLAGLLVFFNIVKPRVAAKKEVIQV